MLFLLFVLPVLSVKERTIDSNTSENTFTRDNSIHDVSEKKDLLSENENSFHDSKYDLSQPEIGDSTEIDHDKNHDKIDKYDMIMQKGLPEDNLKNNLSKGDLENGNSMVSRKPCFNLGDSVKIEDIIKSANKCIADNQEWLHIDRANYGILAKEIIAKTYKLSVDELKISKFYTDKSLTHHIFLVQVYDSIEIEGHVSAIHIQNDVVKSLWPVDFKPIAEYDIIKGEPLSYKIINEKMPSNLITKNKHQKKYMVDESGKLRLVNCFYAFETDSLDDYLVTVDAYSGEILFKENISQNFD